MDQVERVVVIVRETLGDAVLGAYLHGSALSGGLRPTSDLDFLVVTRRATTREEQRSLIARLLPASGRGDPTGASRSVDLAVVVAPDVRPWRYPPALDLQYGDWWRSELERGELPWTSPNPDLALQLAMALRSSRPLVGPPLASLVDPVPPADIRRAMLDGIPDLLADLAGDERNVILTFARIWTTLATGVIRSKDAAATWALPRLPPEHRAVLAQARADYLGEATPDWAVLRPRIGPLVDHVLGEIRRVAAGQDARSHEARGAAPDPSA